MSITFEKKETGVYYLGLNGYQFDQLGENCGKDYLGKNYFELDEYDIFVFNVSIPDIISDEYYLQMAEDKGFKYCMVKKED